MSLQMKRVQIVGLKSDLQKVIRILHRLGCVQIDEVTDAPDVVARPLTLDRETLRTQEQVSLLVARIEGLIEAMEIEEPKGAKVEGEAKLEEAQAGVQELAPQVQSLTSRKQALEDELAALPRYAETLRKLLPLLPATGAGTGNAAIGLMVDREHQVALDTIGHRLLSLTGGRGEIVATDLDSSTRVMLVTFPEEFETQLEELIDREDVTRLRLPPGLGHAPPDVALQALEQRMSAIPEEMKSIDREMARLVSAWAERLLRWKAILCDERERYDILPSLGETEQAFVLVGWVPARDFERLESALKDKMGDGVALNTLPITRELKKKVPIALHNIAPVRPFESLIRMLALPRFGEIDPSGLMALFLPLIFGMILGDMGYGALLLIISLVAMLKFKKGTIRDLLIVIAAGSAWAIVFGFLYGEVFGNLGEHLGLHAIWIDRAGAEDVGALLVMTIAVGAVHITLGLILGVIEAIKHRSRNHLLERGGMLVGLIGLFLMVGVMVKFLPQGFMTPGIAILIVGIVLLGASLGCLGILMGPIEFIGLIGNILSYLRIAAIGLASVYLAKVANDMMGMLGNVIVGVIVAILLHAMNLVLGAFSPTIHSLRLHYVEFFRKFYEGGGRAYKPFRSEYLAGL